MNAACTLCRGACCESLVLTKPAMTLQSTIDWLAFHGLDLGAEIELPTPCSQLDACGACRIHATRPFPCRTYEVGGLACRATVLRRRSSQAAEILALMP